MSLRSLSDAERRDWVRLVRHVGDMPEVLAGLPSLHLGAPPPPDFTPDFLEGPRPADQLARVRKALSASRC